VKVGIGCRIRFSCCSLLCITSHVIWLDAKQRHQAISGWVRRRD
jgi:hypothetical protein